MAVVVQILSVVTYCYLQGVVHRDLKPEPGMVTTDLLLSGASTKQAKFFINVLVEPAEVICPCQWIEQAHLHSIPYWLESILADILS
ncbi:CDPK-related kinase 3-like isoform X2 [Camellia sinensis]|uniref:CDPK-related kinase 3-like isoform X2 n=1 Tax=Camellia sinensis TaxID=4442 RepID=UPI00103672C5|nr:CDPK-related kinase 3-like isoform X2 [Camellia sinensis]